MQVKTALARSVVSVCRPLTPHISHVIPTKWRSYRGHTFCDVDTLRHGCVVHQVYWVYDILKQPRVIATDRDDNYISIPLDCKRKFHIIKNDQSN